MYASDLGAAIAAPTAKGMLAAKVAALRAQRASAPIPILPPPSIVGHGLFRPRVTPVLKMPNIAPMTPGVTPVLKLPEVTPVAMPVTTFDAAPATGAPSSGPMIAPTAGADAEANGEVAQAGFSPWLAVGLLGAFLLLRKKGR